MRPMSAIFPIRYAAAMVVLSFAANISLSQEVVLQPKRHRLESFSVTPAFEPANRINAYGTYLLMEQEELQSAKP